MPALDSALVKRLLKSRPNPPRHPFSLASHRVLLYHRPWLEDQHLLIGHKRTQQECAHTCVPCTSAGLETNIKARQAAKTRNENEEGHAGSRRPLPWHTGAISVEATITCLSLLLFFFLSAVLLRDSFCTFWQLLCVHSVPLCEFRRGARRQGKCAPWSFTLVCTFSLLSWRLLCLTARQFGASWYEATAVFPCFFY